MVYRPLVCALLALVLTFSLAGLAFAGEPPVAALQVGLQRQGLYAGPINGVADAGTTAAVKRFQSKVGLTVDGVAGPATRKAFGPFGRHAFGSRPLRVGSFGWDVAALQFALAGKGFPVGPVDGRLGDRTAAAVRRFQRRAGLAQDGVAGPAVYRALGRGTRAATPVVGTTLQWPLAGKVTDGFGLRGNRPHTGIDIPAPVGTPVVAAGAGQVVHAGWHNGGWGNLVTITHGNGLQTMSAHLSRIGVVVGQYVSGGTTVGAVGASGQATGAHLHFEVRVHGVAIDPLTVLP